MITVLLAKFLLLRQYPERNNNQIPVNFTSSTDVRIRKILTGMGIVMAIIYGTIISLSLRNGNSISFYLVCIGLNVAVALFFWLIATQPANDPQAGMGLGPIMLICGIISVAIPAIALIVFLFKYFSR